MLFFHRLERNKGCDSRVCKEDVHTAKLILYSSEQAVQIIEVRHISVDARRLFAELGNSCIQRFLVAYGDHHLGTIFNEPVGGGQSNSGAATGNDCDFVV